MSVFVCTLLTRVQTTMGVPLPSWKRNQFEIVCQNCYRSRYNSVSEPSLFWYTNIEFVQAYQNWNSSVHGFGSALCARIVPDWKYNSVSETPPFWYASIDSMQVYQNWDGSVFTPSTMLPVLPEQNGMKTISAQFWHVYRDDIEKIKQKSFRPDRKVASLGPADQR